MPNELDVLIITDEEKQIGMWKCAAQLAEFYRRHPEEIPPIPAKRDEDKS